MDYQISMGIETIQSISFDKFDKDFSFIVNGEIYQTSSFVATMLSHNVSKMLDQNWNTSYYEISTEYNGDFNQIIKLGEMKTISIKKEEINYFMNLMKKLGNNANFPFFSKIFRKENISYENVIQQIQMKKELGISFEDEIDFISSNFHNFYTQYPEDLSKLDIDTIEQIISNSKLKLIDENELFDVVLTLYRKSKEYSILFSYVVFLNLSTKSIQEFNRNFDINDMNNSIWENISYRLEKDISDDSKIAFKESHQEILSQRYIGHYYKYIIQHLSEKCHGNPYTQGIVDITYSSIWSESDDVKNIFEQNNESFASKNVATSWIKFDFKGRKVSLDSYTLKTFNAEKYLNHLKSWILEVSNDDLNYQKIDQQENCDLLNGCLKESVFKVLNLPPQRYIRLTQTDENWFGDFYLNLNQIEFSGILSEY